MEKHTVFVAGAGGIGPAVCLFLREYAEYEVEIVLGDLVTEKAEAAKDWLISGSSKKGKVEVIQMPEAGTSPMLDNAIRNCEVILDCLPGHQAPRMAHLALQHNCHYANLTEFVEETKKIEEIAKNAERGFILQTGLAPGFIDILAHSLFQEFCTEFRVDEADGISMKVGALSKHAFSPHYYGFTWSTVGVATEYIEPAVVVRDFAEIEAPALSERASVVIAGVTYEEAITSGGAADLPKALAGRVRNLDYKTLRHPGHYQWIEGLLSHLPPNGKKTGALEARMKETVSQVEDDFVLIYASVQGQDFARRLRVKEQSYQIEPFELVAGKRLKAIQATTAAPLAECARMLLTGAYRGVVHQSQIRTEEFLNGSFVKLVYKG